MADVDNKWSLFGLDLTRSGTWLALGVHQLIFDRGAWLLQRFDPSILVTRGGEALWYRADAPLGEGVATDEQTPFSAVALSGDAVLLKTLHLPASTEEDLDDAMFLEVGLSSPFPDTDTRAAWRVVGRHQNVIEVALAITSQATIDDLLAEPRDSSDTVAPIPEVWAFDHHGIPIPFAGYGGSERRSAYLRQLVYASGLVAAVWVSCVMAITLLAGATALRADRLDATFQQVRGDAAAAATQRESLQLGRTRLATIERAISERPNYQYWLNHIAASAPDTVYLDRLNFDGKEVTVNGYSNNAAVYMRMLTEEPGYTDVTALSAFARDRNNGLERFSIQWRVTAPPTPPQLSEADSEAIEPNSGAEAGS
jgi:Tfp pilus assembly protein PilN